ncbi:MAG: hypothetical protein AABZ30_12725, partial [Myxococcota bacterium]
MDAAEVVDLEIEMAKLQLLPEPQLGIRCQIDGVREMGFGRAGRLYFVPEGANRRVVRVGDKGSQDRD